MRKLEDVVRIVKDEIETIRKRDGELPKTAYLVIEIVTRLKTLQDWEGKDPKKKHALCIREIVEKCIANPKYKPPVEENKKVSMVEENDDYFVVHGELDVDWEDHKSIYRYTNKLESSSENISKGARRQHKKKLEKNYRKAG